MTDTNTDRAAWLEERRKGIGGSDVAAVLGLNRWRTPLQLWEDKTGRAEPEPTSMAARFGTAFEEFVANEFERRTGMKVRKHKEMIRTGEDGWMIANLDRVIEGDTPGEFDAILECKTASVFKDDEWGPSQEAEIVAGQIVTEHEIPLYYETQVQWYLGVTGVSTAYVAVLIGNSDFRIYEVRRDDELIEALQEKCRRFWFECVKADTPPKPINVEDVKKLFARDDGEMREATNDEAAEIGELRDLDAQIKALEEQRKAVASKVILAIGQNAGLTIGGKKAVTYKAQTTRRFDQRAFREADPAAFTRFQKETSTRVLRVS